MFDRLSRIVIIMLVICMGESVAHSANIDPQRPTESLYRIYAEAQASGWTSVLHLQAGNMADQINDTARAVAHWQAAMTQDPVILQRLSQALIDLNRWNDAIEVMRQTVALIPYDDYANHQLGVLLASRAPLQAITHLETAQSNPRTIALLETLDQFAHDPDLPIHIGQVLFTQGRFAYAEYAFAYGGTWSTNPPLMWAYIALTRQAQGKDGADWMQSALNYGASEPEIHYLNGFYLRSEGLYIQSRDSFAQASALDLENPRYYAELGQAYQYTNNMTLARHWLEYAVTVSERDPIYVEQLNAFDRGE